MHIEFICRITPIAHSGSNGISSIATFVPLWPPLCRSAAISTCSRVTVGGGGGSGGSGGTISSTDYTRFEHGAVGHRPVANGTPGGRQSDSPRNSREDSEDGKDSWRTLRRRTSWRTLRTERTARRTLRRRTSWRTLRQRTSWKILRQGGQPEDPETERTAGRTIRRGQLRRLSGLGRDSVTGDRGTADGVTMAASQPRTPHLLLVLMLVLVMVTDCLANGAQPAANRTRRQISSGTISNSYYSEYRHPGASERGRRDVFGT